MKLSSRPRPWLPPKSAFAGFRFPAEVIVVAVRWYLRFNLSYRDVEGRRCVVEPADVLNPRPVGGQIAWASSVNAAAIRRAGGASSPSS